MAENEGGGGLSKKYGPLPAWGWAVLLGGIGGIVWFLRKNQQSAAAADDTSQTGEQAEGPEPTTIVPVNQGLAEAQTRRILDAIKKLQPATGGEETPPPPNTPAPPTLPPSTQPQPSGPPPVKPPTNTPKPNPVPTKPAPSAPKSVFIKAKTGDTYSRIAAAYGHSWQTLWNYQLQPGVRPASTQATLRQRGPDHALFAGSSVAIPADWKKK